MHCHMSLILKCYVATILIRRTVLCCAPYRFFVGTVLWPKEGGHEVERVGLVEQSNPRQLRRLRRSVWHGLNYNVAAKPKKPAAAATTIDDEWRGTTDGATHAAAVRPTATIDDERGRTADATTRAAAVRTTTVRTAAATSDAAAILWWIPAAIPTTGCSGLPAAAATAAADVWPTNAAAAAATTLRTANAAADTTAILWTAAIWRVLSTATAAL